MRIRQENASVTYLTLDAVDCDGAIRESLDAVRGDTRAGFLAKAGLFGGGALGGTALLGLTAYVCLVFARPTLAFGLLPGTDTLELLAAAPDPDRAARLSKAKIVGALRRANRRGVQDKATVISAALRAPGLRQPAAVQTAFAAIVASQIRLITTLNGEIAALGQVVNDHFGRHPDAEIHTSQPGLGVILAARVLGEFGDDTIRFADAKARKNYAGTSPITRASGNRRIVIARYARNTRLADSAQQWAFGSLKGSPGARAYYDTLRTRNIGHQAALRQLANRLIGILHGCLKTGTPYDETTAWAHHHIAAA